jgi:hypothetical protein
MTERNFGQTVQNWIGIVTNVMDPHQSGRVQVRVFGRHDDRANIPDSDLPWAQVIQPVTSAARGRMGTAPVGLVVGSRVFGQWLDSDRQYPLIMGSVGRAGAAIPGQTQDGAPAVNTAVGSIPGATQNNVSNPYSSLFDSRISIEAIDSGSTDIDNVELGTGTVMTEAVEEGMSFAKDPTTGSAEPGETNVLEILRRVDPMSAISALPCLPTNALQLQLQIDLGSIATNLINTVSNAITGAILRIIDTIGGAIDQVLNSIATAAASIANFGDALNALATGGLCGAPRALSSINAGTQSLARSFSSLQGAVQQFGNAPGEIRRSLGLATDTIRSNVPSALFVPVSVSATAPTGFVQEYYSADSDPYPGYIKWIDPNDPSASPTFTLRDGQPNFASAMEHVQYDTELSATRSLRGALTSGSLTGSTLSSIMNQVVSTGQTQGLLRTLGSGFNPTSIAGMAALAARVAPTIISAVQGNFQARISVSVLPNASVVENAVTNFTRVQTSLATRRARLETALRRI